LGLECGDHDYAKKKAGNLYIYIYDWLNIFHSIPITNIINMVDIFYKRAFHDRWLYLIVTYIINIYIYI
jgi:hypothetical protein